MTTTPTTSLLRPRRKTGRKPKPYVTSWNKTIDGLYRCPDGRWRVTATGQKFAEPDERRAVERFYRMTGGGEHDVVTVAATARDLFRRPPRTYEEFVDEPLVSDLMFFDNDPDRYEVQLDGDTDHPADIVFRKGVPGALLWPWLRSQLQERPEFVAEKVGIPQLARLAEMPMPGPSISLEQLIREYETHAQVKPPASKNARRAWDQMRKITNADTLRDLTTDQFLKYSDELKRAGHSAYYLQGRYGKVKTVISFGLQRALDTFQIRAALDRAAVLVAPKCEKKFRPSPIERDDFSKLVSAADDLVAAALLFSLNACMYASEVLSVDWEDVNLDAGTFLDGRGKTGMIRAAVLWPETVTAFRKLSRSPGAIFKSARGDRYHPNSFRKVFAKLRVRAKVPAAVQYNHIRDGAYTAATAAGVEYRLVQILAGHASGMADHYVARYPAMVRPACEAIRRAYLA